MVIYEAHGANSKGIPLTKAYSDTGMHIERDGILYGDAIDPTDEHRVYTETDKPIDDTAATAEDYESALEDLGVEI